MFLCFLRKKILKKCEANRFFKTTTLLEKKETYINRAPTYFEVCSSVFLNDYLAFARETYIHRAPTDNIAFAKKTHISRAPTYFF